MPKTYHLKHDSTEFIPEKDKKQNFLYGILLYIKEKLFNIYTLTTISSLIVIEVLLYAYKKFLNTPSTDKERKTTSQKLSSDDDSNNDGHGGGLPGLVPVQLGSQDIFLMRPDTAEMLKNYDAATEEEAQAASTEHPTAPMMPAAPAAASTEEDEDKDAPTAEQRQEHTTTDEDGEEGLAAWAEDMLPYYEDAGDFPADYTNSDEDEITSPETGSDTQESHTSSGHPAAATPLLDLNHASGNGITDTERDYFTALLAELRAVEE